MAKKNICERHDKTIKLLQDIKNKIEKTLKYENTVEDLTSLLDDIDSDLWDCIDEIEKAKDSGQRMEDRLREYRDAILNLGFSREE